MKELQFLEIIKNQPSASSVIGDDCAYLKDLDIFITQDTLVEDVHFSMHSIEPYLLGRKAASVNLSDLAAALSLPVYITVSLSMPKTADEKFVSELYRGINDVCLEYNTKIIGGDITGSEKIVISICAIGKKVSKYLSSRSYAEKDDCIIAAGSFGASAAGLHSLLNFLQAEQVLIDAHLNPVPRVKEALYAAGLINRNIAAMDCSDGLADALYKTALSSSCSLFVDINSVPAPKELKTYCARNMLDYKQLMLWGGEDYALILCVSRDIFSKLDKNMFKLIGRVLDKTSNPSVIIADNENREIITRKIFEEKSFNHF